ncbi:MAG: ATP-dependent RNA helicase HrpA [Rhodocyclaceae bacterium]|nr:ATP-dependent RNA helicase HrpA [Rhodocyclaceae bacterium]
MRFDPTLRALRRPSIVFDETLPVNQRREAIAQAIAEHPVVIVCGETGSGKTTQLPKICLSIGRGLAGYIGHTQPRRIAARATAARISQELSSRLGEYVGYKVRFSDRTSPDAYIKLMTDGILLAETQGDPELRQYDTLIIDEAHERSLNIDFLLGYLKRLLPRRPDLKLVITSATLDAERFARHFGDAPVIEVSGRLYPIEIRYRPFDEERGRDLTGAIVEAVAEAHRNGPGDILVFLPGEREIREAAEALRKEHPPGLEILPLYARQSAEEQARVFAPSQGRRVVLATNVAETSLTVPGIRYVIDSGLARIKRYSPRNKVEQLKIEPISRAAANQRAGRCGRVAAGVCFRLYAEDDFAKRPPHTEPELLRSSLAGVILRMQAFQLGAIEDFPFLDAPAPRMIADGYRLLEELGAIDAERKLTPLGRTLAGLPTDPRIGRMILAARERDCLAEVLIIASALEVEDPRERPLERLAAADAAHAQWQDERSEFLGFLKLWHAADAVFRHESNAKQRAWCKANFLSWRRLREWRDIHGQLAILCREHGWRVNAQSDAGRQENTSAMTAKQARARGRRLRPPEGYEAIHKALLAGLIGHVGVYDDEAKAYRGAHGVKFLLHPSAKLAKKAGRWIVAAELVETTRLYARCVAKIDPAWLEEVGAHLIRRQIYEPHWEKNAGHVVAYERLTLHGLVLDARRRIYFGPQDPELARALMIRGALVAGEVSEEWLRKWKFLQHYLKLKEEIEKLEHKLRRPDVLVDDEWVFAFFDARIPAGIYSLAAFDAWRREAEARDARVLYIEKEALMRHEAEGATSEAFPPYLEHLGQRYRLSYRHDPGAADDGVTLHAPLALLNQLPAVRLEWLVPGLLKEKVLALLRTLPQKYRHRLQPLSAFAEEFCAQRHAGDEPLQKALTRAIEERIQLKLPLDALRPGELPAHLLMNIRLLDAHGATLAMSRNLSELRERFGERASAAFSALPTHAASGQGSGAATRWTFGTLPEIMEIDVAGRAVVGFPALVDVGDGVRLEVFDTEEKARQAHQQGLLRLFALHCKTQLAALEKSPELRQLALLGATLMPETELRAQVIALALMRASLFEPWPHDEASFTARCEMAKGRLLLIGQEIMRLVRAILDAVQAARKKLASVKAFPAVLADVEAQMAELLPPRFLTDIPWERLVHLPRYLKAIELRCEKLREDPQRDMRCAQEWQMAAREWRREWLEAKKSGRRDPFLEEFRWLLEELRVALFAQTLKTPSPVSSKRLMKMWQGRPR